MFILVPQYRQQNRVTNNKNLTPLFLYKAIFHLCIHDILLIYDILTTPC